MSALLFIVFAGALTSDVQDVARDGVEVAWPTVEARLVGVDGPVEVGEPFEIELVCRHDGSFEIEHADEVDEVLALDERWLVFERRALPDVPADRAPTRIGFEEGVTLESRIVYRLAGLALEPQEGESGIAWRPDRTLAGLGLALSRGTERRFVAANALALEFASLLTPTDTTPRALPGVLPPPAGDVPWLTRLWPLAAGAAAVFGLATFGLVLRRRPRLVPAAVQVTRAQRLAALRHTADEGEKLREVVVDAAALLRASCAARAAALDVTRDAPHDAALTDEEWRARLQADFFEAVELERIDRFLRQSQSVRFGAAAPTRWTVLDLLGEVDAIEDGTLARTSNQGAAAGRRA